MFRPGNMTVFGMCHSGARALLINNDVTLTTRFYRILAVSETCCSASYRQQRVEGVSFWVEFLAQAAWQPRVQKRDFNNLLCGSGVGSRWRRAAVGLFIYFLLLLSFSRLGRSRWWGNFEESGLPCLLVGMKSFCSCPRVKYILRFFLLIFMYLM